MKKLLALLMLAALALTFIPAHADDHVVTGTVLVPTATVGDPVGLGTLSRQERCAYLLGGEATNGLVGWAVPLSADEGDGNHTFTISTTTAGVTPWVVFYEDLGTCDGVPSGVVGPSTGSGDVPEFASTALVVLEGAVGADFTLTIAARPQ